jgi:hypothetical protein
MIEWNEPTKTTNTTNGVEKYVDVAKASSDMCVCWNCKQTMIPFHTYKPKGGILWEGIFGWLFNSPKQITICPKCGVEGKV